MTEMPLRAWVWARSFVMSLDMKSLDRDERGEGVVSSAIAVLIFAALGAVMWLGFKAIWGNASSQTTDQINQIGK